MGFGFDDLARPGCGPGFICCAHRAGSSRPFGKQSLAQEVENASPGTLGEGAPVKRWRLTGRYHCPVAGCRC